MAYIRQFPLTIAPLGTNKQDGFTKLTAEDQVIYDAMNAHVHDGTNGAKISITNVVQNGAAHQPNPVTLTSVSGVLTLPETSNSFIANGAEAVTSIAGWTSGTAVIRWNTARTLTYNATSLILQGAVNRTTAIGDVGVYEITAAGAREIGCFPATQLSTEILNLKIVNGATPNSQMTITADNVPLYGSSGQAIPSGAVNVTADLAINGAGGLDTGTKAISTGYYLWLISNGSTVAGLWSLSATSPSMPSGYVLKRRVGWNKTNASGNLYRIIQSSRKAQYIVDGTILTNYPTIVTGAMAISPVAVRGTLTPATATNIRYTAQVNGTSLTMTLGPTATTITTYLTTTAVTQTTILPGEFILESDNVYYYGSGAGCYSYCYGWEDVI